PGASPVKITVSGLSTAFAQALGLRVAVPLTARSRRSSSSTWILPSIGTLTLVSSGPPYIEEDLIRLLCFPDRCHEVPLSLHPTEPSAVMGSVLVRAGRERRTRATAQYSWRRMGGAPGPSSNRERQ